MRWSSEEHHGRPGRGGRLARVLGFPRLLAAALAAAALAGCSSGGPLVTPPPAPGKGAGATTPATTYLSGYDHAPGDCLTWDQGSAEPSVQRGIVAVSCSSQHLVEVVSYSRQVTGFGASYPGEDAVDSWADAQCAGPAEAYLGYPVDPHGRFFVGALTPTKSSWDGGDRKMWCTIGIRTSAADFVAFTGRVEGADQTFLYPVGTCRSSGAEVPCTGPHQTEVAGTLDLPASVTSLPASQAQWQAAVGDPCDRAGLAYLGGSYPPGVESGWIGIYPSSWSAGRRKVQCIVGQASGGSWVTVDHPLKPG